MRTLSHRSPHASRQVFLRTTMASRALTYLVWVPIIVIFGGGSSPIVSSYVPRNSPGKIQDLVNDLKERLSIPEEVNVQIVAENRRIVSVEPLKGRRDTFLLSIEDGFLDGLSHDELEAVIAHELGHVWIYTHHPYLQTERLANRIAMRLVTRDSLVRVYEKMWERTGVPGDLVRLLGEEEALPTSIADATR